MEGRGHPQTGASKEAAGEAGEEVEAVTVGLLRSRLTARLQEVVLRLTFAAARYADLSLGALAKPASARCPFSRRSAASRTSIKKQCSW